MQLHLAHAFDFEHFIEIFGIDGCHVAEGGVGEDEVGRHLVAGGEFLAEGAQEVEELRRRLGPGLAFGKGLEDLARAAQDLIGNGLQADHRVFAFRIGKVIRRDEALDHELDIRDALFVEQPVGGELVQVQLAHALVAGAFEHLRDKGETVALVHAVDAGKDLLGVDGDIDPVLGFLAAAAVAAFLNGLAVPEVVQDEAAQAFGGMAVVHHFLQTVQVVALAVLVVRGDIDEIALGHGVLGRVE